VEPVLGRRAPFAQADPVAQPPPHLDLKLAIEAREGAARATTFQTPHGAVRTPAFVPVATGASLKGLTHAQIEAIAPEMLLANTYHLHLRPGAPVLRDLGGLHGFTGWRRPWLTDSGGYQVFSLAQRVDVEEEGVTFASHLDGEPVRLGPREAVAVQEALGADLIMAFDQCVGLPAERDEVARAVERTTRWARVCAEVRTRDDQALLGIVQGGTDPGLRAQSARELVDLDLPGYAVGGLAVGEGSEALRSTLAVTLPLLPEQKPRYLMGVGAPADLLDAVALGVDFFDCVLPTRNGRRGYLFTEDGVVRIDAREHERSEAPLDAGCPCEVCRTHSRAYLRHLFATGEHSATTLGSLHNVTFLVRLMNRAREALLAGGFASWRLAFLARYEAGERAWRARHAEDPEGAEGSRRSRAQQDLRRPPPERT
jgi:queuine tRNA-ribosyltransferase